MACVLHLQRHRPRRATAHRPQRAAGKALFVTCPGLLPTLAKGGGRVRHNYIQPTVQLSQLQRKSTLWDCCRLVTITLVQQSTPAG